MVKDAEQFIKCILVIGASSTENSLFRFVFGSLMSSSLSSLYILKISPLSDVGLMKIFLPEFTELTELDSVKLEFKCWCSGCT